MFASPLDAVAARLEILQAISDYSYCFDNRDAGGWAQLFTDDAVWEFRPTDPASATPGFRETGRTAIRAWAERRYADLGEAARFLHHQSSTSFDVLEPERAETRTLLTVTRTDAGAPPRLAVAGTYYDLWRRSADGWRLARRLLVT